MGNMDVLGEEALILASDRSTRVSLAGIRIGRYQLSEHRQRLLSRVPSPGDYVKLERDSLEMMDLAYLTAKTDDELLCHSHPGEDEPEPSPEDRAFLREIGQGSSSVISARTGRISEYTENPFE